MRFLNPLILWALFLALIPIIIYYLMRFRAMRVPWGANYVLERALERLKKSLFLKQFFLILFRTLAVAALVFGFARPVFESDSSVIKGSGIHHFIVVDASYSMLADTSGSGTIWDAGGNVLENLVKNWGPGEQWSMYVLDGDAGWRVEGEVVSTPEESVELLRKNLVVDETASNVAVGLEAVLQRSMGQAAEVFLLADDQKTSWNGVQSTLQSKADLPPIYWINPEITDRENLAVTSVTPVLQRTLEGHPSEVYVKVRNFGLRQARDVNLEVLVDGTFASSKRIEVLPGQEIETTFKVTFDDAGSHSVSARLQKDALEFDNEMGAGVQVAANLKVCVLEGEKPATSTDENDVSSKHASSYDFLAQLERMQNEQDRRGTALFTKATCELVRPEGNVSANLLHSADVVILDGSMPVDEKLAQLLKAYLDNGGGLIMAAAHNVDIKQWNTHLGNNGLLPAEIGRWDESKLQKDAPVRRLSTAGTSLPLFEKFQTGDWGKAQEFLFYGWREINKVYKGSDTLLTFDNGQPFAVTKRRGLGTVVLLASGLSAYKNNLIVRPSTYPVLIRLLSEAAGGNIFPRTVERGQNIQYLVEGQKPEGAMVQQKARDSVSTTTNEKNGSFVVKAPTNELYSGTASMVVVQGNDNRRIHYGVQGERMDSDLNPVSSEIADVLLDEYPLTRVGNWEALNSEIESSRRGQEFYHWIVIAMLLFLLGEMLMEQRF